MWVSTIVHQGYIEGDTSDVNIGKNKEMILIQTSVIDQERASEQRGKTRMTLYVCKYDHK